MTEKILIHLQLTVVMINVGIILGTNTDYVPDCLCQMLCAFGLGTPQPLSSGVFEKVIVL